MADQVTKKTRLTPEGHRIWQINTSSPDGLPGIGFIPKVLVYDAQGKGRAIPARRALWESMHGKLDVTQVVRRTCAVPLCVATEHAVAVSKYREDSDG